MQAFIIATPNHAVPSDTISSQQNRPALALIDAVMCHDHRRLEQERQEKEHAYKVQVAKAKAMATALATIGKFEIFKKVGEGKRIYGRSVLLQQLCLGITLSKSYCAVLLACGYACMAAKAQSVP